MTYNNDMTTLFSLLSQKFGETVGCAIQTEIENVINATGIDLTDIHSKLAQLETALNGAADGTDDGNITIAQNILAQIGVLSNLNTNVKTSLVGAINELKAAVDAKAAQGDSAYQVSVNNGFTGSEAEWLDSLQGQDVDVTQFYTKTEVDTIVDGKVDKSEVTAILANVDAIATAFADGIKTGKQNRINGLCTTFDSSSTSGESGL